jgi:hypothetical protein
MGDISVREQIAKTQEDTRLSTLRGHYETAEAIVEGQQAGVFPPGLDGDADRYSYALGHLMSAVRRYLNDD